MKLSTKGEYGLRAMFDLALRYGEGPISLKSIAERQDISDHYLEQLISGLRKAGLVKSIRGAQGGYILGREPAEITVGDVIRVLEGPIAPMDCVNEEEPDLCCRAETCITRGIWEKVRDSINDVLDSITLEDMVQEAAKVNQSNDYYMYYI
ncbi:RrF2 family transcriptional regulator [Zhaonella formicivorans]|uniref:RrF2 family transcriptional regulator n=1 Tax=Zhaonella formicivorans TaxID=2528593 RepID=UPI0010F1C09F|nr:Rrf2 family transcriptional regulator [Zhaonella formicivorans]